MAAQTPARSGQDAAGPIGPRLGRPGGEGLFFTPVSIAIIGALATLVVTWITQVSVVSRDRLRFSEMADEVAARVMERRRSIGLLTRSMAGMFALDGDVTPAEFRQYIEGLDLSRSNPGIVAVGFAVRARPGDLDGLLAQLRADYGPEVEIWPSEGAPEHYPAVLVEPDTDVKRRLLGFDLSAEPVTAAVLAQAAESAGPVASPRIEMRTGATPQERIAYFVLSPVYRSIDGRPQQLAGFVFAACRARDLLGDLVQPSPRREYRLAIYDGLDPAPGSALYWDPRQGRAGGLVERRTVELAGRAWTLEFESTPAFEAGSATRMVPVLALAGLGLTGAVFLATFVGVRAGSTARLLWKRARRSEEALQQVAQSGLVGVAVFDTRWRVVEANQTFLDLFGYTAGDIAAGRVGLDDLRGPGAPAGRDHEGHHFVGPYEQLFRRKDGSQIWILAGCGPLADGEGRIGFAVDITARKAAEEEVRRLNASLEDQVRARTAELREVTEQLDAFARNVSHDLRAPLRAIEGFAGIIEAEAQHGMNGEARRVAGRITAAAQRMDRLIVELLAYSRLARSELPLEAVSLAEAVGEARAEAEGALQRAGAEVRVAPGLPSVRAHRAVLVRALTNLLDNAAKFAQQGERPRISVRSEVRGGAARLIVEDEGIGLPTGSEQRERIFRVFARLHSQDAFEGTGIGLAIVKKGIERMGGRVGVEDNAPRGARFWIELPLAEEAGAGGAGGSRSGGRGEGGS